MEESERQPTDPKKHKDRTGTTHWDIVLDENELDGVLRQDTPTTEDSVKSYTDKPSDHVKASAFGASVEFDGPGALKRLADMIYDVGEFFINPALSHVSRRLKVENGDKKPRAELLADYRKEHKIWWRIQYIMDWAWASVVLLTIIACLLLWGTNTTLNLNELFHPSADQAATKVNSDSGRLVIIKTNSTSTSYTPPN